MALSRKALISTPEAPVVAYSGKGFDDSLIILTIIAIVSKINPFKKNAVK
jgi:hypothetical protein